jgi:VIT1/CCC1 family predicted Fe2+/Mn2+ transporter/DNA-binding NarL/FixJ family response regulator
VRVVIAEDHALLREGIVALLREHDIDVVAQSEDGEGLLRSIRGHAPDLAIVDVRLPPTFTDEGVRAAMEARTLQPELGILILSQYVEPVYTAELLGTGHGGIGYLLKERVGDVPAFLDAIRRVAAGGTALDREVVAELVQARNLGADGPLDALSPRERDVLELMAEGRTNAAIARAMVVTPGAVEKHVSNIFAKLDLPMTNDDHRRVLGVAGSGASDSEVLTAGIAGLVAGALSMSAGEYVSVSSQRDAEQADIALEAIELLEDPDGELEELVEIYEARGLPRALAVEVAVTMTKQDALAAHARDELGLEEERRARPLQAAGASALAFAIGAVLPLLAVVAAPSSAQIWAVGAVTVVALAGLGALGARLGGAPVRPATLRVVTWGVVAMVATYGIGALVGTVA